MNFLFIDTETNGRPIDKKASMTELSNWPRVTQLAWEICDEEGLRLFHHCYLIEPNGWVIPEEQWFIDHNFSTEKNKKDGVPMPLVLDLLITSIQKHDIGHIVAHNIPFDYNVLGAEMIRYGRTTGRHMVKYCTMELSTKFCKIPFGRDRRPWKNKTWKQPSLSALYKKLFNEEISDAHQAWADVAACRKCFFELIKMGIIQVTKK